MSRCIFLLIIISKKDSCIVHKKTTHLCFLLSYSKVNKNINFMVDLTFFTEAHCSEMTK